VLDQFENLLDSNGYALPNRPGIGEWLDALNSQPCTCRILLTSRPDPQGTLQLHFFRDSLPEVPFGEKWLSLRERRNVRLEGGGHLLQVSNSQAFSIAKTIAVALMMDTTIGRPVGSSVGS
jgi:hypothetical protein